MLILNSLLFATLTTVIALTLGIIAFIGMAPLSAKLRTAALILSATCLLMPSFLLAGSWWNLGMKMGLPIASLPYGAGVLALQLWPAITLVLLGFVRQLDPSLLEAATLMLPTARIWTSIILRLLVPGAGVAALLVFILALNNFVIPTTFQTRVYIADVYVMFSSLYDTRRALLQSIPLWIISLAAFTWLARISSRLETGRSNRQSANLSMPIVLPRDRTHIICLWITWMVFLFSLLPPLYHLLPQLASDDTWTTLRLALPQFAASLVYAGGGALLSTLTGLTLWCFLILKQQQGVRYRWTTAIQWVLATPFILSGFFLGILLVQLGQWAVALAWWQGTWLLGVVALAIRFTWIPFEMANVAQRRIHQDILDAARLCKLPLSLSFRYIHWPVMRPSLLAATWLVFLLALWDVETLLLVYPPGGEPASLKIFQFLHYGYDAQVAVLSLGLLGMGLLPGLVLIMLWCKQNEDQPSTCF